jgi:hypothetical protein
LAANPKIYGQMVTLLQPYSKFSSVADKAVAAQAIAELRQDIDSTK